VSIQPGAPPGPLARRALLFTPGARLGWVFRGQRQHGEPFAVPPPDRAVLLQAASDHADTAQARYLRARRYAGVPALTAAGAVLAAAVLQATIRWHLTLNSARLTVTGGWLVVAACLAGMGVTWQVRRHAYRAVRRREAAWAAYLTTRAYLGVPSVIALAAVLAAGAAQAAGGAGGTPWAAAGVAVVVAAAGITVTAVARGQALRAASPAVLADGGYSQALAAWQQQAQDWEQAQVTAAGDDPQWVSTGLPAGCLRADVFGGTLAGWQALLTTHGASLLAARPLLVVDLTGEVACQELAQTAAAAGVPAVSWLLPSQLAAAGLLATLTPAQLAAALAEAIHAGNPGGGTGGSRADRALDTRVAEQLAEALGGNVTPARLAAAARAALGHATASGPLSAAEQGHIAAQLFPAAYRRQIEPALARIDAFLADLARRTDPGDAAPAPTSRAGPGGAPAEYLTCLALEPAARTARAEALAALAVQWLTVQVSASREPAPAVILAGADEITRGHLERLADACEGRGVPLTLLFRHLRETGLAMLGGGAAAFMRLGNHAEAEQAASYIGRQHKFVLSQLTATHGGSRTATATTTQADTAGDTITVGWNTGWNTTSTGLLAGQSGRGRAGGRNRSVSRSVSRTWSDALSWAEGSNWSGAAASQRVYEYAVEPPVLQHLPDQALLLVTSTPGGPVLHAVECDPAIITLPGAATAPARRDASPGSPDAPPGGDLQPPGITAGGNQPPSWPDNARQPQDRQPAPPRQPRPRPFRWPPNPGTGQ